MTGATVTPIGTKGAEDPHHEARTDLAAAFRWAARLNLHEAVANHFSLAVSDDGAQFLMNPRGRHFSRMRASELMLLDANDPDTMKRPDAPDITAWCIHGRLHAKLPQARCLLHVHSKYATVIAALKDSTIYPIDQNTMRFFEQVAVDDDYDGIAVETAEGDRLATLFGNKSILMMGNHGVLVAGPSVAQAFDTLYYLERSCETLVTAYATSRELRIASDAQARRTAQQWADLPYLADDHFSELKRMLDGEEPDYRG